MLEVYHYLDPVGHAVSCEADEQTPLVLVHVADVDTDVLNHAYQRTNTIDSVWHESPHPSVTVHWASRSTSAGDVIHAPECGEWYRVVRAGYRPILRDDFDKYRTPDVDRYEDRPARVLMPELLSRLERDLV